MIDGVIFDLEGTLVKLPIDYDTLYRGITKELKIPKVKPLTKTVKMLDSELRERVFKLWENAELKALPNSSLNDEGIKLYRKYSNEPIALVTMQGKRVVKKILDDFHLSFNIIFTREDEIERVQQIKRVVDKMGWKPRKVLMVGDRDNDEAAAIEVGCKFVRVRT